MAYRYFCIGLDNSVTGESTVLGLEPTAAVQGLQGTNSFGYIFQMAVSELAASGISILSESFDSDVIRFSNCECGQFIDHVGNAIQRLHEHEQMLVRLEREDDPGGVDE